MSDPLVDNAKLTRQTYGIAMAQNRFGGPRGIWLECRGEGCDERQVIVGSNSDAWAARPDADAVKVFQRHGSTGEGPLLKKARCPACSNKEAAMICGAS